MAARSSRPRLTTPVSGARAAAASGRLPPPSVPSVRQWATPVSAASAGRSWAAAAGSQTSTRGLASLRK